MPDPETITLADGRTLCFARTGAAGGKPVIYFHGAGSSRIEGEFYDEAAAAAGVEIIATDRPGCGGSSPAPGRTFTGYGGDVRELADHLGLGRFAVAGMSNGGVYAMAVAAGLSDRVTAAIPINPSTPMYDPAARRASPRSVRLTYALIRYAAGVSVWSLKRVAGSAKADERVRRSAREVLRQPDSGYVAEEIRLASAHWGFDHAGIAQPVEFFTGDRDAGFGYAKIWTDRLPDARLHVFAGGHGDFQRPDACERIVAAMASAP